MLCGLQVEEDGSLSKAESFHDEQFALLRLVIRLARGIFFGRFDWSD